MARRADQVVRLAPPVLPELRAGNLSHLGTTTTWKETDDLATAGAEVPVPDPRVPPGGRQRMQTTGRDARSAEAKVFTLNAESGEIRFGDGERGARPPATSTIRATYDFALGAEGNVREHDHHLAGVTAPSRSRIRSRPGAAQSGVGAAGRETDLGNCQHRDRMARAKTSFLHNLAASGRGDRPREC